MIVLIFVSCNDSDHTLSRDRQSGVSWGTSRVGDALGQRLSPAELLIELCKRNQATIGRKILIDLLEFDGPVTPKPEGTLLRRL